MSRTVNSSKSMRLHSLLVQHLQVTGPSKFPSIKLPNTFVTVSDERDDFINSRRLVGTANRLTVTENSGAGTLVLDVSPNLGSSLSLPQTFLTTGDEDATLPNGNRLVGTANQITVTPGAAGGDCVLSIPATFGLRTLGILNLYLEADVNKDAGNNGDVVLREGFGLLGTGMNVPGASPSSVMSFQGGPSITYIMTISSYLEFLNSPVDMDGGYFMDIASGSFTRPDGGTLSVNNTGLVIAQPEGTNFHSYSSFSHTFAFLCTANAEFQPRYRISAPGPGDIRFGISSSPPLISIIAYGII